MAVLTWLVHRRPALLPVLAVGALAFRVPVSVSGSAANLLLPLYAVIAAGTLSYAWRALRAARDDDDEPPPPKLLWRLKLAFAVVLVLYGAQSMYSTDVEPALKNVCLFYVPFALLFLLLLEVRWTPSLLRTSLGVTVVLALVFAAIGCVEFATGHLLITNAKVVEANDLLPYFRVNSLFFDPNIYGRYLALTMILLATVLLWTRRRREAIADRVRARAAVGRARVLAVAVELRGAAARPRGAGRAALEPVAGAGGAAVPAVAAVALVSARAERAEPRDGRPERARPGDERAGEPDRRRARDDPRPAAVGLRLGRVHGAVPRARARQLRQGRGGLAHDPAHGDRRAGRASAWLAYLALVAVSLALLFRGLRAAVGVGALAGRGRRSAARASPPPTRRCCCTRSCTRRTSRIRSPGCCSRSPRACAPSRRRGRTPRARPASTIRYTGARVRAA